MANPDVQMTLDEAVDEVLTQLTGLGVSYDPSLDRYHTIAKALNRAVRQVALETEWSYYASTEELGTTQLGQTDVELPSRMRPRIINDDAVRLVHDGVPVVFAYILPRDALHKYRARGGLWCSVVRTTITFSRPIHQGEEGLTIVVPVMREPRMFEVPAPGVPVEQRIREQLVDFDYPDLVIARANYLYAQSDPVMQPRVQTLEAEYKDLMYQLVERDERHTDSPYMNEFLVPIKSGLSGGYSPFSHLHPHSDERGR